MTTLKRLLAAVVVSFAAIAVSDGFVAFRVVAFQLARSDTERPLWNASLYLGTYLAGVLGITVAWCHRPRVRAVAIGVTLLAACIHVGVAAVNGTGFTHHEASLLFTEPDFLRDALAFFLGRYSLAVLGAAALGAGAAWLVLRIGPRLRAWAWLALPFAALLASHQVVDQTFGKVYQFPVPLRLALLAAWEWEHRLPVYEEREAPYFAASGAPLTDHIVLIVDESVSGHWLGVNGAPVDTTPWLSGSPRGLFNYGIASAISNLSSSSNLVLQTGLRPDAFPDRQLRALRDPNLFSYLAAAGYHTSLIDAQTYSDHPPNLMSGFDLRRIHSVVRLREAEAGLAEHQIDFAAIPLIREQVESHPRSFTYLIKTGAHLPYGDKAPAEERVFSPALDGWADSGDPRRVRNSYWNALRWSVDHFLRELARVLEASGREVLVVYTSDHGQWLADEASAGRRVTPHATAREPPPEQAAVPLLLLAFGPQTRAAIAERFVPELVDAASAFEIFPTVLQAAGYAATDTRTRYAPSLFERVSGRPPRIFLSGNIFARGGAFYVLNRELEADCFINPFDVASVRSPSP